MSKHIDPKVEVIVRSVIDGYYLTSLRPSPQQTIDEVIGRCRGVCLRPPHPNTIRARIRAAASKKRTLERREGGKAAQGHAIAHERARWAHDETV